MTAGGGDSIRDILAGELYKVLYLVALLQTATGGVMGEVFIIAKLSITPV